MEAKARNMAYRLFKVPMEANLRARTLSETRGFLKALVETDSDRILGFTAFGVGAGEIMSAVQMVMIAGLPYTALRDAVLTHPTLVEGLIALFSIRGVGARSYRRQNPPRTDSTNVSVRATTGVAVRRKSKRKLRVVFAAPQLSAVTTLNH